MAAGDIVVYQTFKLKQMTGTLPVDITGASMKLMLVTSAYVPDATATGHDFISDANANEVATGASYSAGGPTVTVTVVNEASVTRVKIAADEVFAQDGTGFTNARYWILYEDTGGAATTDPVVAYGDFGTDKSVQTGSLTIDFENTNGGTLFQY